MTETHLEEKDRQQEHARDRPGIQEHGREQGRVVVGLDHKVVAFDINKGKEDVYRRDETWSMSQNVNIEEDNDWGGRGDTPNRAYLQ